jgi:hypothetical protein
MLYSYLSAFIVFIKSGHFYIYPPPILIMLLHALTPITLPVITLILHLPSTSETYTRHLDFSTYRTWTHFASLLSIFSDDLGIVCLWIWDVVEKMEVGPGDWEARVRPGWRVDVVCCMMGEMGDDEDDGFDEADWELGVGYWCDDVAGVQWGFARWRRQVERGNGRVTGRGKRGYVIGIVGLVWVLAMIWGLVLWG